MRRFNLTKSVATLLLEGLVAFSILSVLSPPSRAGTPVDNTRQGLPGRRISGGSRSPNTACLTTPDQPVVALMPKSNLGRTAADNPTLWFSLPAISPDRMLEFGLYNDSGDLLFQKNFSASGTAEVASLSLPKTAAPLTVGKDYRWYLSVVCNPESRAEDLVVTGWIRRIQLDSKAQEQLASASSETARLALYQQLELWHDALTALARLRQIEPAEESLEQQWVSLLKSVDLPQAIAAPLGNELTPTPQLAQAAPNSTPEL